MAHFAQTLYRFPGGQLFTNFQTGCDVCTPKRWNTSFGRSFASADNGSSWHEIPPIANGDIVFKSCIPSAVNNSITCMAYYQAIISRNDNRTGAMLTSRFEVSAGGNVSQVWVGNSTVTWPAPGLIPFDAKDSIDNFYMVQDGNPLRAQDGGWLLPMYGKFMEYLLPPNTTHQNQKEASNVLALVKATDSSLSSWEFYSWVNIGRPWQCAASRGVYWPLTPHNLCNPTEAAMVRLANQDILLIWRNDPGYNITLMAQVSRNDGRTWSVAAPMHGKIRDGAFENIVDAPFGVEPKLQMMASGVVVLSTGRPRMYLWALPPNADPLTEAWQPFDQGKLHNAAVAQGGGAAKTGVPIFQPTYWEIWRGAKDPSLRGTGCCTDAYTGIVALSPQSDTLVMTYDMLAFNCPKGVAIPKSGVCDFILSMPMKVVTSAPPPSPTPSLPPTPPTPPPPPPPGWLVSSSSVEAPGEVSSVPLKNDDLGAGRLQVLVTDGDPSSRSWLLRPGGASVATHLLTDNIILAATARARWNASVLFGGLPDNHAGPSTGVFDRSHTKASGLNGLYRNWRPNLKRFIEPVLPLLRSGAVAGVFVGDEVFCSNLPYSNYSAVFRELRAQIGGSAVIWTNECGHPSGWPVAMWPEVPPEIDWLSVDMYNVRDGNAEVQAVKQFWGLPKVATKLSQHQRLLLVPGTFACGGAHGASYQSLAAADAEVAKKLRGDIAMVEHDERMIGLWPWHMTNRTKSQNSGPCDMRLGCEALLGCRRELQNISAMARRGGGSVSA